MHTRFEWDLASDRKLAELAAEGVSPGRIADIVSTADNVATVAAVRRRCAVLGIRIARTGVWTPGLDARLIALWKAEPKLSLRAIVQELDAGVDHQAVSRRAGVLGLPSRYASVEAREERAVSEKALAIRSPIEGGGRFHHALTTPKPRIRREPLETPCPFIEPTGKQCCAPVDRRPDRNGVRPSQYCAAHRPRVLPLSRGSFLGLGTVATYARGHRFG